MLRVLKNLFHRRVHRSGMRRDGRSRFRDPRFVSFLASNNRKTLNTDFQDALLRGRRLIKHALVLVAIAGAAWVMLESARAVSLF
jgi:hypothetical protein